MDLAQQGTARQQSIHPLTRSFGIAVSAPLAALVVIALVVAFVMSSSRPATSSDGSLGSDAWRAFRAEEHSTAIGGDPLAQQSAVDFRNSEHSEAR